MSHSGEQIVRSAGIYHGLPKVSDNETGLTAIITGANGISGYHQLKVLAEDPSRWKKIYCLSRRPPYIPGGLPERAEHIALDFLNEPDEIAKTLKEKGVYADYVFFFSYIQPPPLEGKGLWSDAEETTRVNTLLLTNFLGGLEKASITPKRFMLQTGAKQYGIHLGPTLLPQSEEDPRVTLESNFYYHQEDALFDWCKRNNVEWNVARPSFILGAVPDAAMNIVQGLGIYAAVQSHLKKPLDFPAGLEAWEMVFTQSSAKLNAYLEEWAVLSPNTANQAFNAADDSAFSWARCWPKLASWYGIEHKGPSMDESAYQTQELGYDPPPRGFGPRAKVKVRFTLTEWGKQEEVQQAWRELADKHDLSLKAIPDPERVLAFTDGALLGGAQVSFSMDKAKKMGWHGFVDSSECILEVLQDFVKLKMLPPMSNPRY